MEERDLPLVFQENKKLSVELLKSEIASYLNTHKDLFDWRKEGVEYTSDKIHLRDRLQEMLDSISNNIGFSQEKIKDFLREEKQTILSLAVEVRKEIFGPSLLDLEEEDFVYPEGYESSLSSAPDNLKPANREKHRDESRAKEAKKNIPPGARGAQKRWDAMGVNK